MEDSDDNVTFGERRAILQLEVQLDEDKPLFSAEDRRPDKAAVQCPEIQEAALLLALNENPGDRLASNKRTRLHDLFLQLSDAERALFLQEVNGQPSTKSKKSKKSEANSKTKPETTCKQKTKLAVHVLIHIQTQSEQEPWSLLKAAVGAESTLHMKQPITWQHCSMRGPHCLEAILLLVQRMFNAGLGIQKRNVLLSRPMRLLL